MNHAEKNHIASDAAVDNSTVTSSISPYLLAEHSRLLKAINTKRQSGPIAPAYCWLTESSETKGTRTYTYIRLITEEPGRKPTSRSLGKPNSEKHRQWQIAIAKREEIAELEQQLKMLEVLIERQRRTVVRP
jgi:hypothetical protein